MNPLALLMRAVILLYRYGLSPFTPAACRYAPTCSAYALEAIAKHGAWHGGWLGLRRICRCHPWGGDGHDPVPAAIKPPPGRREKQTGHGAV